MGSIAEGLTLTLLVSVLSLAAVTFPLYRGFRIGLQALRVTRPVDPGEIERGLRPGGSPGRASVTVQMLRVLRSAIRESQGSGHPAAFLIDASRECVSNDYDVRYVRPMSMFANVLPPIGFIGTTGGLLILFLSMQVGSDSLELGALALALTSSIFALIGYAFLEALRIRLSGRLLARIDDALAFHRRAAARERSAAAEA